MRRTALGLVLLVGGCVPVEWSPPDVVPVGQEPALDPNHVYDEDAGMACYPTDVRTGEQVDVCHWLEP